VNTPLDAILGDDAAAREAAVRQASLAPEHVRAAIANTLAPIARDLTAIVSEAEETGQSAGARVRDLERVLHALAALRVPVAKSCFFRVADEGTTMVKATLARALRGSEGAEARAALAHLLSDDDARLAAIVAIAEAPWPAVLPDLMEIAEADDRSLRLAIKAIAKCGASAGIDERNAAADFLLEQLDDDIVLPWAVDALLRFGASFPGVAGRAAVLAQGAGRRKIAGLCLLCATGTDDHRLEVAARSGAPIDAADARLFLEPLLADPDSAVRGAAERTRRAAGLG
jgi:hypothetical protein